MTALLNDDEIRAALDQLPGWSGGQAHLVREVAVEEADRDALEDSVMKVADARNHHPEVERTENGLRFVIWTQSAGGVTAADVELAAAIDQVLSGSHAE